MIEGGEPTLHPDFFKILEMLFNKNIDITLKSNGRLFFYPAFCAKTVPFVKKFLIKIEGNTSFVHDPIVRVEGAFNQTIKGIDNLINSGADIAVLLTPIEQNFIFLPKTIDLLKSKGVKRFIVSYPLPCPGFSENYSKLAVRFSELISAIDKIKSDQSIKIQTQNFPLCISSESKQLEPKITQKIKKAKSKQCTNCSKRDMCVGVFREYDNIFGNSEFTAFENAPKEIAIEITSYCNLECPFCFARNHYSNKHKEMPLETFKKIADKLPLSLEHVRITGGEPLLRKDFFDVLEYLKSKGHKIWLNTNGTLIDDVAAKKISRYVENVLIPLNGWDSESDRGSSGRNLFEKKINAIKLLKKYGVKTVRCGTVATRKNIENIEKIYALALQLDLDDWEVYRPIPLSSKDTYHVELKKEDLTILVKKLNLLNSIFGRKFLIANALPFCFYDEEKVAMAALGAIADDGHMRFVIDVTGEARPSYFMEKKIGNTNKQSIQQIWKNEFMVKMRNLDFVPEKCRSCDYVDVCRGGSRHIASLQKGSFFGEDPLMRK